MLEEALEIHKQGKLDDAESRYREILTFNPDDPETLHLLAIVLRQKGQVPEALRLLRRAIELAPDRANYYLTLAGVELHARLLPQARADFETALKLNPNLTSAYSALGHIGLMQGNLTYAETQFKTAFRTENARPDLYLGYGSLLLRKGDIDEAIKYLTQGATVAPDDAAIQGSLGKAYFAKGLFAFAEKALENSIALRADFLPARVTLAQVLYAQQKWRDAERQLLELVERQHDLAFSHAMLGDIARQNGDWPRAAGFYRKSLEQRPDQAEVVSFLASCLSNMGHHKQALTLFQSYLEKNPGARAMRYAYAAGLAAQGLLSAAKNELSQLLRDWPNHVEAQAAMAAIDEQLGELEAAEKQADAVLAILPKEVTANLVKARACFRHGQADRALQLLEQLDGDRANPQQLIMINRLKGLSYDRLGDFRGALAAWRENRLAPISFSPTPELALPKAMPKAESFQYPTTNRLPWAFLVGAPGSGVETVAKLLAQQPQIKVLADRFAIEPARRDFLLESDWSGKALTEADVQIQVRKYLRGAAKQGGTEEKIVDWLPYLDAGALPLLKRSFGKSKILFVTNDKRDSALNWLAFGCAQHWAFPGMEAAIELLETLDAHRKAAQAALGAQAHAIDFAAFWQDPTVAIARICDFLELPLKKSLAQDLLKGKDGMELALPPGRHLSYDLGAIDNGVPADMTH